MFYLKKIKKIYTCFVFILFTINLIAQSSITIKTNIENMNCLNDTLKRDVNIYIINNQQSYLIGNLQFKGCTFNYKGKIPKANYKLSITIANIGKEELTFEYKNDSNLILPTFYFSKEIQLKEVTVLNNSKRMIKIEGNKIIYEVKNNSLLSNGSINDVIKKIPGVIPVPMGSGVSINGKIVSIYINGTPSSLSGTDLTNYLQSLPASQIDKIEVIKNPGASFDAKTGGAIFNIILIFPNKPIFFGLVNLNYALNNNQKISPSFILNWGFKKINLQINTGYSYVENNNTNVLKKQFTEPNRVIQFIDSTLNNNINRTIFFNPIINYNINKKSTFVYQLNWNKSSKNQYFNNDISANIENINLKTKNNFNINSTNQEHILKYDYKIDSLGQNLDATYYYSLFNKQQFVENTTQTENAMFNYGIIQLNNIIKNYFIKINYTKPSINKKIFYNAGLKYNEFNSNSIGNYNLNNLNNYIFQNKTYNNLIDFNYKEKILSAYNELNIKYKDLSLNVGLRVENYQLMGNFKDSNALQSIKNTNLFPAISTLYELNNFIKISGAYTQKYETPSYNQIDPNLTGNFNNYNKNVGNPNFKLSIFNNVSFDISIFDYLSFGVDYSTSNNFNVLNFIPIPNSFETKQTIINYDNFKSTNYHINIPIPVGLFTKGLSYFNNVDIEKANYLYVSTNFSNTKIGNNNTINNSGVYYVLLGHFALPYNIQLSTIYTNFNGNYQIYQITKPIQNFGIDISTKIKNNIRLSFFVYDMFNQLETNATLNYLNLKTNYYLKEDSRYIGFKITCNIGNNKNKSALKDINDKNETKKIESSNNINPINN